MKLYQRDIALEWYRYGLEKEDDFFIRFMMHWVAFNWLYNSEDDDLERDRIRSFYYHNKTKFERFDAFSNPAIKIFNERPVYGRDSDASEKNYEGVMNKQILPLIWTLYTVRCNLFHGSKRLMIKRDQELVRDSAVILEGYLKELLSDRL